MYMYIHTYDMIYCDIIEEYIYIYILKDLYIRIFVPLLHRKAAKLVGFMTRNNSRLQGL